MSADNILKKLDNDEISASFGDCQWTLSPDKATLSKEFKFKDFISAWSWMNLVALNSEKMNHHPEWSNVYNTVNVKWTTHDVGGISKNDILMSKICDDLYNKFIDL